ncbi:MAG: folylpolyglutamate synthase/dihydrofolate synthase family protein [Acidobacteriota bacterium]
MTSIERLFALEHFGIKLGLAAMQTLLVELGQPHRAWPALHVAGTNGKGSVSAMTSLALTRTGQVVGLYTSPHLFRLEERIAIDGVPVSEAAFAGAVAQVFAAVDRLVASGALAAVPTFFEVSTAAAFVAFAEARVDVAVIEVGLGGRFDATNVLTPVACAITTIDFDHERHLGTTIEAIAREKAGIAKTGVPLVVGDVPDEALRVIEGMARHAGAPVTRARHDAVVTSTFDRGHSVLTVRTPVADYGPVRLGLAGAHQAGNAVVAIRLLEAFGAVTSRRVPPDAVTSALTDVRWPARLEWLHHAGTRARVLVDAAHNPAGARALAEYLAATNASGFTLVTSVMADKNVAGVLAPLLPYVERVIVTAANLPRATEPAALAAAVRGLGRPGLLVEVVPDPVQAVAIALAWPSPVLLTGSIYLVGPMRARLVAGGFESA